MEVLNTGDSDIFIFKLSDTTNFKIDDTGKITTRTNLDYEKKKEYRSI